MECRKHKGYWERIKEIAAKFEGNSWGFIADISELDTIEI